jgi:hypothetical protein
MRALAIWMATTCVLGACTNDSGTMRPGVTVSVPSANAGAGAGSGGTSALPVSGSGGVVNMPPPMMPGGTGGIAAGTGGVIGGTSGSGGIMIPGAGGMKAPGTGGMTAPGTGGMVAMGSGGMTAMGTGGSGACTPNLACQLAAKPSTGDIRQDCVDRINQFRVTCACLAPYERWKDGEACADQMAMYDTTMPNMPHAGARAKICGNGQIAQDECPGWPSNDQVISGCLQQMWDEGPPPSGTSLLQCESDTAGCFQAHGHFINMSSTSSKRVACGFATNAQGAIWAVQNFSF